MKTSGMILKFRITYTTVVEGPASGDDIPAEPRESFHTKAVNDGADNGVPAFEAGLR